MSTGQCQRLLSAYREAQQRNTRVIVLMGGPDFWSNGLHLNVIEAADSPADESWRNINAMNDLAHAIITTNSHITIAALQGNAGAGGVFLALATDKVLARSGIILNPHYKGMGNLYGSEYWTYLLPRRVGQVRAHMLTEAKLPMGTAEAKRLGLIDDHFGHDMPSFVAQVGEVAAALASNGALPTLLAEKRKQRARDEAAKPLASYRDEELQHMRQNFYGFDPSYHVARYDFVYQRPKSRTPPSIAKHRRSGYKLT
jgi:putative two-component system hydrogenase maturation factor HypX/HoxX